MAGRARWKQLRGVGGSRRGGGQEGLGGLAAGTESRRVAEGPCPACPQRADQQSACTGARVPRQAGRDGGLGSAERWGSGQHKELSTGSQEAEVVVCLVTNALWP